MRDPKIGIGTKVEYMRAHHRGGVMVASECRCAICGVLLLPGDPAWDLHAGSYPPEIACLWCAKARLVAVVEQALRALFNEKERLRRRVDALERVAEAARAILPYQPYYWMDAEQMAMRLKLGDPAAAAYAALHDALCKLDRQGG